MILESSFGAFHSMTIAAGMVNLDPHIGFFNQMVIGSTVLVMALIVFLAFLANRQLDVVSDGIAVMFEHVFDFVDGIGRGFMGRESIRYTPLLMSLFVFILFSNWAGLLPWLQIPLPHHDEAHQTHEVSHLEDAHEGLSGAHVDVAAVETGVAEASKAEAEVEEAHHALTFETPTSSYNMTLGLGLVSFLAFMWFGFKEHVWPSEPLIYDVQRDYQDESELEELHQHSPGGIKGFFLWLMHYLGPVPGMQIEGVAKYFMLPFMAVLFVVLLIMEEFARIVSLSFRLFGNIFGEHQAKIRLVNMVIESFQGMLAGVVSQSLGAFLFSATMSGLLLGVVVFVSLLGGLAGFIQAWVFTVLSALYIAEAVHPHH